MSQVRSNSFQLPTSKFNALLRLTEKLRRKNYSSKKPLSHLSKSRPKAMFLHRQYSNCLYLKKRKRNLKHKEESKLTRCSNMIRTYLPSKMLKLMIKVQLSLNRRLSTKSQRIGTWKFNNCSNTTLSSHLSKKSYQMWQRCLNLPFKLKTAKSQLSEKLKWRRYWSTTRLFLLSKMNR